MNNFLSYLRYGGVTYVDVVTTAPQGVLNGKTALVTGGSGGIGKAIASTFLQQGAEVIITGRNENAFSIVKDEYKSERLHTVQGDIAEIQSLDGLFQKCLKATDKGTIDILVNNAGVYTDETNESITESEWNRVVDTDLKGLYFFTNIMIQHTVQEKRHAKIINISSNRSFMGDDGPYGVSKRGVNALTEGLAKKYLLHGIIINGIAPGSTVSNINNRDPNGNVCSHLNANGRLLLPEEIAELALYLASDISNGIVGQTIVIDGGTILK